MKLAPEITDPTLAEKPYLVVWRSIYNPPAILDARMYEFRRLRSVANYVVVDLRDNSITTFGEPDLQVAMTAMQLLERIK